MSNNGNNKATVTCPNCHQRFSADLPKMGVINDLRVSMAIATHEKPIRCLCGKYFAWVIQSAEASWQAIALNDEQVAQLTGSPLIVPPPPGLKIVQ